MSYVQKCPAPDGLASLNRNNGNLKHHGESTITPQFLGDAAHDKFVSSCANEESNDGSGGARESGSRGRIDVTAQEAVNRDVPLARELEPVTTVPPVGIEVAVRKAYLWVSS